MRPLSCDRCGAEVLVRKSSWQQTSVQWTAEATRACAERAAAPPTPFERCAALHATIRRAALHGTLPLAEAREDHGV